MRLKRFIEFWSKIVGIFLIGEESQGPYHGGAKTPVQYNAGALNKALKAMMGQTALIRSRPILPWTNPKPQLGGTRSCKPLPRLGQDRGSPDVGVGPQIIGGRSQDRSPDLCKLPAGPTMETLMIASTIVDVATIIAFGAAVSLMAMMFLLY